MWSGCPHASKKFLHLSISPPLVRHTSEPRKSSLGGGYGKTAQQFGEPQINRRRNPGWAGASCPVRKLGWRCDPVEAPARHPRRWGCCPPSHWRPRKLRRPMILISIDFWTACFRCCSHSGRCFSLLWEPSCCGMLSRIELRNCRRRTTIFKINIFRIKILDVDFTAPRSTRR